MELISNEFVRRIERKTTFTFHNWICMVRPKWLRLFDWKETMTGLKSDQLLPLWDVQIECPSIPPSWLNDPTKRFSHQYTDDDLWLAGEYMQCLTCVYNSECWFVEYICDRWRCISRELIFVLQSICFTIYWLKGSLIIVQYVVSLLFNYAIHKRTQATLVCFLMDR